MSNRLWKVFAGLCTVAMIMVWVAPAGAQASDVKEKAPMYSYVGQWSIPRSQWAEMDKSRAAGDAILQKDLADGMIVGYGDDTNLIHQADGPTHDDWWSAMSMAALLNVLDQFHKSGNSTTAVLSSATKHWDGMYVSRYYNWHPGTVKDGYTRGMYYKLKADAPNDAVESLSKNLIVPLMEKMLADGTIAEYEVDTEAIHTEAPGAFFVFYLSPNAEGMDKVQAALQQSLKANPTAGPAFGSMTESAAHRDYLVRTNATYK